MMNWETEITEVYEPYSFVDNQRSEPHKLWYHLHKFGKTDNGTEITEIVKYAAPFEIFGKLSEMLMIERKVNEFFDYRFDKLNALFGVL